MMNNLLIFEAIKLNLQVGIYTAENDESVTFETVAYRDSQTNLMAFTNQINDPIARELHRNLDKQIKYINDQIKFVNQRNKS